MELLKQTPDKYYELCICDPPYGIGDFSQSECKMRVNWNDEIPNQKYFIELKRVSKKQIIWGANYYPNIIGGAIIWYKGTMHPQMSDCEIASISGQKKVDYVYINWQSGFYRTQQEGAICHPCQKPVKLYRWLLENYAKPGDKILDTHLGSGSIAIACHYMGFDLTGSELDTDYFNMMIKRIKQETKQISMF